MLPVTAPLIGQFMPGSVRRSKSLAGWLAAMLLAALPAYAAPKRVVSMNFCTDQTAMLLAAPGQLISISNLAHDPRMSPMAGQAADYPINYGRAEEIYILQPDLVLAGQYASANAVQLLRRLGIRVEVFPPAESFDDIRAEITRVGDLLGRKQAAADLLAQFNQGLERVSSNQDRGRVALYYANGFTSGTGTLAGAIIDAAGYNNIAADYGIDFTSSLPLELLIMSAPDMLITGARWPGRSRSEAILDHPALYHIDPTATKETDQNWICGTPFVLQAIETLQ